MKRYSEERTEAAVRLLIENLTQNLNHSGIILDEFEATHNDRSAMNPSSTPALVAGHFALKDAVDKINNELNKK
ncbi:hypothetical protein EZ315_16060 (plasmid) [Duncaniella freteri]|uniref:Uncharacterized protein n=1 Tax=Duncaniella freteri TaxID=2530391 RepID=A0A4Z0V2F5_9BACT|nr:hypothetical protein [Duncaniella freteri]TGG34872.1 hypothetical protein EZ315_16060 [Duncaniella freteri]